jgi:hypothetical protein
VAAEIRSAREIAGGERGHLVAQGELELREAMEEDEHCHIRGARLGDVDETSLTSSLQCRIAAVHAWLVALLWLAAMSGAGVTRAVVVDPQCGAVADGPWGAAARPTSDQGSTEATTALVAD